jgi:hypothetical protein
MDTTFSGRFNLCTTRHSPFWHYLCNHPTPTTDGLSFREFVAACARGKYEVDSIVPILDDSNVKVSDSLLEVLSKSPVYKDTTGGRLVLMFYHGMVTIDWSNPTLCRVPNEMITNTLLDELNLIRTTSADQVVQLFNNPSEEGVHGTLGSRHSKPNSS